MSPATKRPQQGVALIEVLVAAFLLSLGILGLIGLQARAINLSVDAEDRNRASLIANDLASAMWLNDDVNVDLGDVADDAPPSWANRVQNLALGGLPGGTIEVTALVDPPRSADVTITWRAPQRTGDESDSRFTTRVTLLPAIVTP